MTEHRWRSVFTKHLGDGEISQSSRVFRGDTESKASGRAIDDAMFWKGVNGGNSNCEVTVHVERVDE